MSIWPREGKAREVVVAFVAGASLMSATLVNFVHHNDYPFLRPEIGLLFFMLLLVAAAMAPFYVAQRQWGRSILEGVLVVLFIDFNTDSIWLMLAAGFATAAVTAWRRTSLLGPMAVLGVVIGVTTLAGVGGGPSWMTVVKGDRPPGGTAKDKPAIIHIIFDEHLGLEGLAFEGPEGRRLRDELRTFYLNSGFAIYGGAYSEHYHSANSLPNMLNFGRQSAGRPQKRGIRTGQTEYLQRLVEAGYRLTVFQADYADFCSDAVFDQCITYDSSSLRPTLAVPMADADRATVILHKFLALSLVSQLTSTAWGKVATALEPFGVPLPRYHESYGSSSTVGTLEAFDDLTALLKAIRPGEAIFAHLLLPHHPYAVRSDCSYLPWPWHGLRTEAPPLVKLTAYHEQVRCTSRKVAEALQAISRSPAWPNVIVVLHGDHGSRLSRMDANDQTKAKYSDSDLVEVFSTFFAICGPDVRPAYYIDREPVSGLLEEFAASGFQSAPPLKSLKDHPVYLTNSNWDPVRRVTLPASWSEGRSNGIGQETHGFPVDHPMLYAWPKKGCHA